MIHAGLLLSEDSKQHGLQFKLELYKLQTCRIKITNDAYYLKQLNVHRCDISPVRTGLQSIFLLLSRDCLKGGQRVKIKSAVMAPTWKCTFRQ